MFAHFHIILFSGTMDVIFFQIKTFKKTQHVWGKPTFDFLTWPLTFLLTPALTTLGTHMRRRHQEAWLATCYFTCCTRYHGTWPFESQVKFLQRCPRLKASCSAENVLGLNGSCVCVWLELTVASAGCRSLLTEQFVFFTRVWCVWVGIQTFSTGSCLCGTFQVVYQVWNNISSFCAKRTLMTHNVGAL